MFLAPLPLRRLWRRRRLLHWPSASPRQLGGSRHRPSASGPVRTDHTDQISHAGHLLSPESVLSMSLSSRPVLRLMREHHVPFRLAASCRHTRSSIDLSPVRARSWRGRRAFLSGNHHERRSFRRRRTRPANDYAWKSRGGLRVRIHLIDRAALLRVVRRRLRRRPSTRKRARDGLGKS